MMKTLFLNPPSFDGFDGDHGPLPHHHALADVEPAHLLGVLSSEVADQIK